MQDFPETRLSLIAEISDPQNQQAWDEFVQLYEPAIYRIGRLRGLQHADALDLVQTVLISLARSITQFQQQVDEGKFNGRFRYWLSRVAINATINSITRRPLDRGRGQDDHASLLDSIENPSAEAQQLVELEYLRQRFLHAAEQVKQQVSADAWNVFELTAIKNESVEFAASETDKSVGAVYAIRSRIMKRLTAVVHQLEQSEENPE